MVLHLRTKQCHFLGACPIKRPRNSCRRPTHTTLGKEAIAESDLDALELDADPGDLVAR